MADRPAGYGPPPLLYGSAPLQRPRFAEKHAAFRIGPAGDGPHTLRARPFFFPQQRLRADEQRCGRRQSPPLCFSTAHRELYRTLLVFQLPGPVAALLPDGPAAVTCAGAVQAVFLRPVPSYSLLTGTGGYHCRVYGQLLQRPALMDASVERAGECSPEEQLGCQRTAVLHAIPRRERPESCLYTLFAE